MAALSFDETRRLLKAVRGTEIDALVHLAVYTGMRRSELLGLRWGDVKLEQAMVTIVRGLHALRGGELRYESPKSRHGRRPVELSPAAVAVLADHHKRMANHAAALGFILTDETPVFVRPDFRPMLPDTVSHRYRQVAVGLGFSSTGIHALRHTHATLMLQQGVHPLIVSRRLGHASVQITLDTYSHVVPSMQREAAMSFEQGLRGDGGG
jgi:integrase